jgi:hypothetical protein
LLNGGSTDAWEPKALSQKKKGVVVGVFGCLGCIWWIQKEILVFSFPSGLPLEEQTDSAVAMEPASEAFLLF